MQRRGLLAGLHLHIQNQTGAAHEIGVIDMGRTPTLVRIVADLGSLLPAIESFDGGVHIQNPRLIQQGLIGVTVETERMQN